MGPASCHLHARWFEGPHREGNDTTETITTTPPAAIACPPGCKHAEAPEQHEVEDAYLGDAFVTHEVDFGDYAFRTVKQPVDGSVSVAKVVVNDLTHKEFTDPATMSHRAHDLLSAADWLAALQDA